MICLIFGESDFPNKVLEKIKEKKIKYFIIDLTRNNKFKNDNNSKKN